MNICRFKKKHIDKLEIPKEEKAGMLDYYDLYLKDDLSPAFTLKYQGMAQGIGGIRHIGKDIGEAWFCFNPDFLHQHKKTIITKVKDYISFVGITFKLKEIRAIIDINSERDKLWIQFLGFKRKKKLESGFDVYVRGV